MDKSTFDQFAFSDIPESAPYIIKNFIISNSDTIKTENFSFEHPFTFEGIIFFICLKGTGKMKISFKEYNIEKDTIITILPNQIIEIIDDSDDFFVEILACSPDLLSDLPVPKNFDAPNIMIQTPALKVSEKDAINILRYHSFIIDTFNNEKGKYHEQIIKGLMYSLLLEVTTLYLGHSSNEMKKTSTRSEEIVERFLSLLKDHYQDGRTASYYADKMFITPKYLSSTLKKVTGRTINSWIEDAIIIGAKILLKSTNLTVLQISEELNFPNPSYFGRFFKKHTGITPVTYRESE